MLGVLLGGRYRLEREIGAGGMAQVFRATDEALGRVVAIKMPRDQYAEDPLFRERFLREARAAGRLSHPNIVAVYDVGEQGGRPFLVMQLVEGPTLREEIARRGPLPIAEAVAYAQQVAEALAYAHLNGIVHRDVKPANILLTNPLGSASPSARRALLSDFGIARSIGEAGLSSSHEVFGTVHYLAPERALGHEATPASDVYALGVVLYEMLTGRVPFSADTPIATALAHARQPVPPPRAFNPALPAALERVLLRALAKNPAERFRTGAEFAAALAAIRSGALSDTERYAPVAQPVDAADARTVAAVPVVAAAAADGERGGGCLWLWAALGVLVAAFLFALGLLAVANRHQLGAAAPVALPTRTATPAPPTPTAIPQVRVPAVEGMDAAAARTALRQAGFEVREGAQEFHPTVPAGRVIRTAPPAGRLAAAGSTVELVVSRGPELIEVPAVQNLLLADAKKRLEEAGFEVVEIGEWNSAVARDTVLLQTPRAGERVPRGSRVTITYSLGRERTRVPNVVGMREEEAKRAIEQARLRNAPYVNYQTRRDLPESVLSQVCVGCVLSSTPAPGTEVDLGTEVFIAVRGRD
ncbi:MAG: Stk1 family PASTA domain-containing Ser/Thr kinase [Chloroflexota bacterium]|nr:Stk1 family PASTA domain-containing Ser/Thr kinase [Dehalococcoidia bacterium]MDW8253108.1 Stk1 family PASTA domain-containing Ser/Thr kinase [Chloroflexota bacterium]